MRVFDKALPDLGVKVEQLVFGFALLRTFQRLRNVCDS
jgi:hypothetical protein